MNIQCTHRDIILILVIYTDQLSSASRLHESSQNADTIDIAENCPVNKKRNTSTQLAITQTGNEAAVPCPGRARSGRKPPGSADSEPSGGG